MSSTAYFYLKVGIYCKADFNVFYKSSKGINTMSRTTNSVIESILSGGSHRQQCLALNNTLAHSKLINQASNCGYF